MSPAEKRAREQELLPVEVMSEAAWQEWDRAQPSAPPAPWSEAQIDAYEDRAEETRRGDDLQLIATHQALKVPKRVARPRATTGRARTRRPRARRPGARRRPSRSSSCSSGDAGGEPPGPPAKGRGR